MDTCTEHLVQCAGNNMTRHTGDPQLSGGSYPYLSNYDQEVLTLDPPMEARTKVKRTIATRSHSEMS